MTTRPNWSGFKAWLATSNAYDFLDDAVLGSLTDNEVMEVLADFNIEWNKQSKHRAAVYINDVLKEGY